MITTLMLYSLLVGLVLGGGALVADRALRTTAVATRWTFAGALAVLSVLTLSAPWRTMSRTEVRAVSMSASLAAVGRPVAPRVSPQLDRALGVAWATTSTLMLVTLTLVLHRLSSQRRQWPHAVMHGVSVRVSRASGPALYGVFSPEIVVPVSTLRMRATDQHLMLEHEQAHRRARDPLLLACSAIALSLIPWHPVAWWLASRVRLAVELDCDARVLRAGNPPRAYAALLLAFAQRVRADRTWVGVSALLASRSHLERRLRAMTVRPSSSRSASLAVAVLVCAAFGVMACAAPVPDVRASDPSALSLAVSTRDLLTAESDVTIDGQPATLAQAYALRRGQVASVMIDQSPADSAYRRIRIKTRPAGSPEPEQLLVMGNDRRISIDSILAARARRNSARR